MVDTGGHDRPLVLLPEVIGAGDEGDDLIRFGIGIEYHGGRFPRGIVPTSEIRFTGKRRPFGRFPSLHDVGEAHGVRALGFGVILCALVRIALMQPETVGEQGFLFSTGLSFTLSGIFSTLCSLLAN